MIPGILFSSVTSMTTSPSTGSAGGQDDIAVALRIALSRYLAWLHQVHESAFLIFFRDLRKPGRGAEEQCRKSSDLRHEKTAGLERNLNRAANAGVPLRARLLLISPIAGIQGGFANALKVEMGADNASRVKEAE